MKALSGSHRPNLDSLLSQHGRRLITPPVLPPSHILLPRAIVLYFEHEYQLNLPFEVIPSRVAGCRFAALRSLSNSHVSRDTEKPIIKVCLPFVPVRFGVRFSTSRCSRDLHCDDERCMATILKQALINQFNILSTSASVHTFVVSVIFVVRFFIHPC